MGKSQYIYMAVCQNLVPLVNIKIAGKWMFIPLKMVLIVIDPYPYIYIHQSWRVKTFSQHFGHAAAWAIGPGRRKMALRWRKKISRWATPKSPPKGWDFEASFLS